MNILTYANSRYKASSRTGSVRAAGKAEEEDLIAGVIVTSQKIVGFAHVFVETGPEPAYEALRLAQFPAFLQ